MRSPVLLLVGFVAACAACGSANEISEAADAPMGKVDAAPPAPRIDAASVIPAGDTFDGVSLDGSWAVHNVERVDIHVAGGQLRLAPHANQVWLNGKEGALVYKLVTGDFKVTTTVHARLTADLTKPLDHGFQTGGLMVRDQDAPPTNLVFINMGLGTKNALAVLHESTKDGSSMSDEGPWGADAQLRICRTGATFTAYKRNPGDTTWTQDYEVMRADLPSILQVGPDVSAGVGEVNSTFLFDAVD